MDSAAAEAIKKRLSLTNERLTLKECITHATFIARLFDLNDPMLRINCRYFGNSSFNTVRSYNCINDIHDFHQNSAQISICKTIILIIFVFAKGMAAIFNQVDSKC